MEKKRYLLIEEKNGERQTVYGIAIMVEASANTAIEINRVSDITCNKGALEELIRCCNSLELSQIHLDEVIEDFLLNV